MKAYYDKQSVKVKRSKNNLPGVEWGRSFMQRHKRVLARRISENVKHVRAKVSPTVLQNYFDNLKETLEGVPPENIINYDETNLTDDPGKKKVVMKRGTKYPERILNATKSSISIMFAGTASGTLLGQYVVYKARHLYDTWTEGGPPGTYYN